MHIARLQEYVLDSCYALLTTFQLHVKSLREAPKCCERRAYSWNVFYLRDVLVRAGRGLRSCIPGIPKSWFRDNSVLDVLQQGLKLCSAEVLESRFHLDLYNLQNGPTQQQKVECPDSGFRHPVQPCRPLPLPLRCGPLPLPRWSCPPTQTSPQHSREIPSVH
jgi:hypothetical protein